MATPTNVGEFIEAIYKAHFDKRVRDATSGEITLYEYDSTTVLQQFDSTANLDEINPKE